VSVRCLAILDGSLIVHTWAQGASIVEIVRSFCSDCPLAKGEALDERAVIMAEQLARDLGAPALGARLVEGPEAPQDLADGEHVDRREFLQWLRLRSISTAASVAAEKIEALTPETVQGEEGAGTCGARRSVAVKAMRRIADHTPAGTLQPQGPTSMRLPQVDARSCSLCGLCATFCPSGALRIVDDEGVRLLGLIPSDCPGCALCEQLCDPGAITMSEPDRTNIFAEPRILKEAPLAKCRVCSEHFADLREDASCTEPMCPLCTLKNERFKGFY
jgi:Pyruvate/2-oxoacid:ferredoxin oxidoreductase delta subunit